MSSRTSSPLRMFAALILLGLALMLFASVFMGCGHVGASPNTNATGPMRPAPLSFEIIHQRGIGFDSHGGTNWSHIRIGHIINRRTVGISVSIDCDLTTYNAMKVDAAEVAGEPGELWFSLLPEDRDCNVTRVNPKVLESGAIESKNSSAQ